MPRFKAKVQGYLLLTSLCKQLRKKLQRRNCEFVCSDTYETDAYERTSRKLVFYNVNWARSRDGCYRDEWPAYIGNRTVSTSQRTSKSVAARGKENEINHYQIHPPPVGAVAASDGESELDRNRNRGMATKFLIFTNHSTMTGRHAPAIFFLAWHCVRCSTAS